MERRRADVRMMAEVCTLLDVLSWSRSKFLDTRFLFTRHDSKDGIPCWARREVAANGRPSCLKHAGPGRRGACDEELNPEVCIAILAYVCKHTHTQTHTDPSVQPSIHASVHRPSIQTSIHPSMLGCMQASYRQASRLTWSNYTLLFTLAYLEVYLLILLPTYEGCLKLLRQIALALASLLGAVRQPHGRFQTATFSAVY